MATIPYVSVFPQILEAAKGFNVSVEKIYETQHGCYLELQSHPNAAGMTADQKTCFIESQSAKAIFGVIWKFPGSLECLKNIPLHDLPKVSLTKSKAKKNTAAIQEAGDPAASKAEGPLISREEKFAQGLIEHYKVNKDIINADKVNGDVKSDRKLLRELLLSQNGTSKYSHRCKASNEIFVSLTVNPTALAKVQRDLNVEIIIDYKPGAKILVHFKPLDMIMARGNKRSAELELQRASKVMSFHLWCVDRELAQSHSYPNLQYSYERYLMGWSPEFREWSNIINLDDNGKPVKEIESWERPVKRTRET